MLKRCTKCGDEKELEEEFCFVNKAKGKRRSICRACQRILWDAWYSNTDNRKSHLKRTIANNKINYWKLRQKVNDFLKTHPCVDCGESDYRVLEFDHIIGKKEFNISDGPNKFRAWKRIASEIEKCEIRCANCHRLKHFVEI